MRGLLDNQYVALVKQKDKVTLERGRTVSLDFFSPVLNVERKAIINYVE
jgi:hypothetical protein